MNETFEELSNSQYDDYSGFDNSYNDDYDFIQDYENMMDEIDNPDLIDLLPRYDEDEGNIYEAIDNWDNYNEPISDKLAGKGKRSYNKYKEDENEFKKEFAEELTMLYDLLDEVNKFSKKLDKKFDALDGSKAKGTSKYLNDLIESVLSSKTTKLQILKEIAGLKKTIQDLKIKSDGKKPMNEGNGSLESSANMYFKNIMNVGRNNFIRNFDYDDDNTLSSSEYSSNDDIEYANSLPDAHSNVQERIAERLEKEHFDNFDRRSEDADKYIMYENMQVELVIKFNVMTNDWEMIAIDKNGQQIFDYPIPTRKELGKVKFSADHKYATDQYGRSYKCLEVYGA